MVRFVPELARRVLEFGCGGGYFLAQLKRRQALYAVGIEPVDAAAAQASAHADVVLQTDVQGALAQLGDEHFDAIVFNDVLEHLVDPWETMVKVQRLLASDAVVMSSIPNVRYWPILNGLLMHGEWAYTDAGVLDRMHLRFFTRESIQHLYESTSYKVREMHGINGTGLPSKASLLNRLIDGRLSDCQYPQFTTVASRA